MKNPCGVSQNALLQLRLSSPSQQLVSYQGAAWQRSRLEKERKKRRTVSSLCISATLAVDQLTMSVFS